MADPLSISAGILAVISTLQDVVVFIGKIEDAPEVLQKAQGDLLATIDIVKDIKHNLEVSAGTEKSQHDGPMLSVLAQCQQLCVDFRGKLSHCVCPHNDRAHQVYYRIKTAMKSETIEKFRNDLQRSRQLVHMRLQLMSS